MYIKPVIQELLEGYCELDTMGMVDIIEQLYILK